MDGSIRIRNEVESDYRRVEEITRKAFWNLYVPGCAEHYLAHVIRSHADFLPELDLVIEVNEQVIGSIMYTKTTFLSVTRLKKLNELSSDTGAVVVFQDEVHFNIEATITRQWRACLKNFKARSGIWVIF